MTSAPARRTHSAVLLLSMPLSVPHYPSLALGLLKPALEAVGARCDVRYFSLDYVDHVGAASHATLTDVAYYMGQVGEWVFADAAHGRAASPGLDFLQHAFRADFPGHYDAARIQTFLAARAGAAAFIEHCLAAVDWSRYDVVGFTSAFQQTMASLALARRIRQAHPGVLVVFGGVNCQDAMGVELLRQYEFVDAVCLGEGDTAFPAFVRDYLATGVPACRPGIAVRAAGRLDVPGASSEAVHDMDSLPVPDYDDFFAQHAAWPQARQHAPAIVFETARGCWWGERQHCTFCGLNGVTMAFRAKSQARAYDELAWLVRRHACRDVANADKILDMQYFTEFLPRLAAEGPDVTIYYEAKVNLDPAQLALLSRAGVKKIQFGIETFDTELLRLMHKGSTMLQNIEVLKLSAEAGIYVEWLALSGFPGETHAHYARIARLLPKLRHLQPPAAFIRARADRFSPYANAPGRYGVTLQPLPAYRYIFDCDDEAIARLAHHFHMQSPALAAHDDYTTDARTQYDAWRILHPHCALYYTRADQDAIEVHDARDGQGPRVYRLSGAQAGILSLCSRITPWRGMRDRLGICYTEAELADALAELQRLDLVVCEGSRVLALPLRQPGFRAAPSWNDVVGATTIAFMLNS